MSWIMNQNPVFLALIATLGTWAVTALGASLVFFFKTIDEKVLDLMLGFSAGVMIAASYWSLLAPAIDMAEGKSLPAWAVVAIGFVSGAIFLMIADKFLPHISIDFSKDGITQPSTKLRRIILLVFSITIHNIPEGLAVGVAFGALASDMSVATVLAAISVAVGIGIQNFPEGTAVSIPLRREGLSCSKSFFYGQASALVEPVAGVIGAALVITMRHMLPYALAFAAGAMIYVVAEELIPEGHADGKCIGTHISTIGCILGFTVMMVLDVALG